MNFSLIKLKVKVAKDHGKNYLNVSWCDNFSVIVCSGHESLAGWWERCWVYSGHKALLFTEV